MIFTIFWRLEKEKKKLKLRAFCSFFLFLKEKGDENLFYGSSQEKGGEGRS